MWLPVGRSCPDFPTVIDYNLGLLTEINVFSPKLPLFGAFYHSNRTETRTHTHTPLHLLHPERKKNVEELKLFNKQAFHPNALPKEERMQISMCPIRVFQSGKWLKKKIGINTRWDAMRLGKVTTPL